MFAEEVSQIGATWLTRDFFYNPIRDKLKLSSQRGDSSFGWWKQTIHLVDPPRPKNAFFFSQELGVNSRVHKRNFAILKHKSSAKND